MTHWNSKKRQNSYQIHWKGYWVYRPGTAREDVLECLILTILSQNTTDVNRDRGYTELKDRFPTWEDVLQADVKAIEVAIRLAGLGNQKSRTIKNFLSWLKAEYGELSLEFIHDMETEAALETPVSTQRYRYQNRLCHALFRVW